ncbi:MAG: ParB/RepB/Spo0J family partition protein [Actinobacteria bacterium]|nr:MAG: ParB/RepB/Spo0J family partition protein [Actinomycetota bacterium]
MRPAPTRTGRWRWSLSAVPEKRRGLGRGLELLVGGPGDPELAHLPVETIHANPRQPRKRFDGEATSALADSIRAQGLVQPVVVRPREAGGYELIAGERRWRAAREAGVPTLPALVREADDRDTLLLSLVENVAREQLSAVEEARAYALLLDEFALSLGELSERVGKAKPTVSNRLRLLELSDDVLALLERGELTEGHARAVLAVPDQDGRRRLARQIIRRGMSVRAAERAARWAGARTKPRKVPKFDPALLERVRSAAERLTGFPARIVSGRLEIAFTDETELAELAEALEAPAVSLGGSEALTP